MSDSSSTSNTKVFGVFGVRKQPGAAPGDHYSDKAFIEDCLQSLWGWNRGDIKIISGGSHGVELITEEWAIANNVEFERVKPVLNEGHIAPFDHRNERIIDKCTHIEVFWDGEDMQLGRLIRLATIRGKEVHVTPVTYK